ncbi:MAG TPA: Ppx/GppA phosphatase family protein [Verrucomicrobiae bacterium]|nr:Ppx/GppA phosphatase family protein [Verrucomicrobiae bacterium]
MTIATVDIGTNTVFLLVAGIADDGGVTPLYELKRIVRVGEGVDATGRVGAAAVRRLCDALADFKRLAQEHGAARVIVGATSASRDARNQAELIAEVRRETGLDYEILSGEAEAKWAFRGAISVLTDVEGTCAVLDIGGGSTEIVVGDSAGEITYHRSLNIGALRLTERFFSTLPPARAEVGRAEDLIARLLDEAACPLDHASPLIGSGETTATLALVRAGLPCWDALGASMVDLEADEVHDWRGRLLQLTADEVLALNPAVLKDRADVFPASVLILDAVMQRFGIPVCKVSPRGLRHGLALRFAAQSRVEAA